MRRGASRGSLSSRRLLTPGRTRERRSSLTSRPRILVVEDDTGAREALVLFLGYLGYEVTSASNGSEALEQVTDVTPDLVVTDWRMPGMSGLTLCLALRERRHTMPIVVVTSAEEVFSTDQPVDARLRKPIDPAVLDRVICKALQIDAAGETV